MHVTRCHQENCANSEYCDCISREYVCAFLLRWCLIFFISVCCLHIIQLWLVVCCCSLLLMCIVCVRRRGSSHLMGHTGRQAGRRRPQSSGLMHIWLFWSVEVFCFGQFWSVVCVCTSIAFKHCMCVFNVKLKAHAEYCAYSTLTQSNQYNVYTGIDSRYHTSSILASKRVH